MSLLVLGCSMVLLACWPVASQELAVVYLTENNFDLLVTNSDEAWLVEFLTPWCPYCKMFTEEFAKVAEILKGRVHVGVVNADECKVLKRKFGLKKFPTFLIFGRDKTSPVPYKGPRDVDGLVQAALTVAGSYFAPK